MAFVGSVRTERRRGLHLGGGRKQPFFMFLLTALLVRTMPLRRGWLCITMELRTLRAHRPSKYVRDPQPDSMIVCDTRSPLRIFVAANGQVMKSVRGIEKRRVP